MREKAEFCVRVKLMMKGWAGSRKGAAVGRMGWVVVLMEAQRGSRGKSRREVAMVSVVEWAGCGWKWVRCGWVSQAGGGYEWEGECVKLREVEGVVG